MQAGIKAAPRQVTKLLTNEQCVVHGFVGAAGHSLNDDAWQLQAAQRGTAQRSRLSAGTPTCCTVVIQCHARALSAVLHTHVIRRVFDLLPESSCCVLQGLLRRVTSPHAVVLQGACTADDTQVLGACDKGHHSESCCLYPMPAPLFCTPAHSLCCCTE